jgi:hypothetical protein
LVATGFFLAVLAVDFDVTAEDGMRMRRMRMEVDIRIRFMLPSGLAVNQLPRRST